MNIIEPIPGDYKLNFENITQELNDKHKKKYDGEPVPRYLEDGPNGLRTKILFDPDGVPFDIGMAEMAWQNSDVVDKAEEKYKYVSSYTILDEEIGKLLDRTGKDTVDIARTYRQHFTASKNRNGTVIFTMKINLPDGQKAIKSLIEYEKQRMKNEDESHLFPIIDDPNKTSNRRLLMQNPKFLIPAESKVNPILEKYGAFERIIMSLVGVKDYGDSISPIFYSTTDEDIVLTSIAPNIAEGIGSRAHDILSMSNYILYHSSI